MSNPVSYLTYTQDKQWIACIKHWSAQVWLFFIILSYFAVEFCFNTARFLPRDTLQWILFIIALGVFALVVRYVFPQRDATELKIVSHGIRLLSLIGVCVCAFAYYNELIISVKRLWLYVSFLMSAISIGFYPSVLIMHQGPIRRFFRLFFSIASYLLAIWSAVSELIYSGFINSIIEIWEKVWTLFEKSLGVEKIPDLSNWIPMGLTLLTGCLLVISWSPGTAHDEWNPYQSYKLESPERRALMAFGFLVVVVYSALATYSRLALLGFFVLLAADVTIMVFCYVMQSDNHMRKLVADYITYVSPKYLYFSAPASIYHKMARVSQHIIESKKLNMAHEKGRKMIRVLMEVVKSSEGIQLYGKENEKADWAFAIGLACMPSNRPVGFTPDMLKTYYYDLFDYVYNQMITATATLDLKEKHISVKYILFGLLMGAVRLCAKDEEWSKAFGYEEKNQDYQHCLRLICPNEDMKHYYVCMTRHVMPDSLSDDDSLRDFNSHDDYFWVAGRREEISSMFYQSFRTEY